MEIIQDGNVNKAFLVNAADASKTLQTPKVKKAPVRRGREKETRSKEYRIVILYTLKDTVRCCFCGGAKCKHENFLNHRSPYLTGLHSDLINADLVASQRPSSILMDRYKIIQQFKEKHIGLIVNLQREGEHPYCGPNMGLEEFGFSYNPQDFISEGIDCLVAGWKDMDVPDSMLHILNIVKAMHEVVKAKKKKVLIHCHAGYGRTGIVLACYQIFTSPNSVKEIVAEIRKVRKKCIEKKAQYSYCEMFKKYIEKGRCIYTPSKRTLDFYIYNQTHFELKENLLDNQKMVPKLLFEVMTQIQNLASAYQPSNLVKGNNEMMMIKVNHSQSSNRHLLELQESNLELANSLLGLTEWTAHKSSILEMYKGRINMGNWDILKSLNDLDILSELLWDWLDDSVVYILPSCKVNSIFSEPAFESLADTEPSNDDGKLIDILKSHLNLNEFHTIWYLSGFLISMSKQLKNDEFELRVIYKLATLLLGFGLHYYHETFFEKDINIIDHSLELIDLNMSSVQPHTADKKNKLMSRGLVCHRLMKILKYLKCNLR